MSKGSPFVGKVSTPKSCWSGALTVNSKEENRKIACSASNYLSHCGNSRSKNDLFGSCGTLSKSSWMASPSAVLPKKLGRGPDSVMAELRHSSDSSSRIVTPNKLQNRLAKNSDFTYDLKPSTPEIYSTARFIDTPRRNVAVAGDHRQLGVDKSNLVVAVRVRPLNSRENSDEDQREVVSIKENHVNIITGYGQTHTFSYDHCFSSCYPESKQSNNQETVYQSLARPLLDKAFEGYNTCLFAYGQTGSGKSYSVMGPIGVEHDLNESAGIVPRFCHELFSKVESLRATESDAAIQVHISFFEIYKEKIHDLLCQMKPTLGSLRVREHPQTGPYVVDLSQHAVNSFDQVQRWLLMGNRQRATASTSVNERSSRSHAIFTITLVQRIEKKVDGQSHEVTMTSRINFIDLAGSERIASVNSVGERREEGLTINQSLLTLGRVITALAEQTFVPYRESVLTWLLKDSLGGDSKTVMLATVSPCAAHVEETLATLRYACQARTIINTARICEDPNARLIRHLREQIRILEEQVMLQDKSENQCGPSESIIPGSHPSSSTARQVNELTSEIVKLKMRLADLTEQQQNVDQTWHERIAEAEMKRSSAERVLASYGLVEAKDPLQPCLVNVNQDPSLSGTLFFPIKSGKNLIGLATCSSNPPEIQLNGVMIEEQHCCIENTGGILTLTARGETYVNGKLVDSTGLVALHHGDRVILAGTHFFHLHYPTDNRRTVLETKIPDFQTACDELRRSQDERLQVAVREAQEKTRSQMLTEIEELRDKASLEISMQKHSYEDEIASLNRVLKQQQNADLYSPPHITTFATSNVVSAEEIEAMLRDTQQRLTLPSKDPDESSFVIHSMIKEGNAICKRFQSSYSFSRKDTLSDRMETAILVHDRDRQLILHWSIETMKEKLQILREAIEEQSASFPSDMLFDRRDVWRPEDESPLSYVEATIRDKLAHLTQNQSESHNSLLDESRFSIDLSSRRSSLLCRSPPVTNSCSITTDACKEIIMTSLPHNSLTRTFWSTCFSLRNYLANPEHTSRFAVFVTTHTFTIVSMLPGVISHISSRKELPSELKSSWLETAREQGQKLQNAIEFVLQGIKLDSQGLLAEWVVHAQKAHSAILALLSEVTVVFEENIEGIEELPLSIAITGYLSAQKKVHQAVINITDEVRMKITQLPDENSIDSISDSVGSSYFINSGWLVKACHDSITQVLILLERLSDCIRVPILPVDSNCLNVLHLKFHQRIDVLLRIGSTIENVLVYLEHADLNQVKVTAAALEVQATTYADQMDAIGDVFLGDLSFAVGMVHKIVAERRRMLILRRGRDISYSPLPPRLLAASPSSKRASSVEDDVEETNVPGSFDQSSNCEDEDGDEFVENVSISSLVIQRALRFEAPVKSSLKSATVVRRYIGKNVRFNLADSTTHQGVLDQ